MPHAGLPVLPPAAPGRLEQPVLDEEGVLLRQWQEQEQDADAVIAASREGT